jgi:diazepam-binding inhibitor (GABA receptor modulating acyl-CoA-binding protein)
MSEIYYNLKLMADFEAVAQKLRDQKPDLSNEQKSEIYGLFKQASMGDNTAEKPGLLSGFEARGKWDAWEAKKGMS